MSNTTPDVESLLRRFKLIDNLDRESNERKRMLGEVIEFIRTNNRIELIAYLAGTHSDVGFRHRMFQVLPAWNDLNLDEWREIIRRTSATSLCYTLIPFLYQQFQIDSVLITLATPDLPSSVHDEVANFWGNNRPLIHSKYRYHLVLPSQFGYSDEELITIREGLYKQGAPRAKESNVRIEEMESGIRMLVVLPPDEELSSTSEDD